MNEARTQFVGTVRGLKDEGTAADVYNRPRVWSMVSGQDLDEGRLAGAVLSEQGVHLADRNLQIDSVEGAATDKRLGEVDDLQRGRRCRRRYHRLHRRIDPGQLRPQSFLYWSRKSAGAPSPLSDGVPTLSFVAIIVTRPPSAGGTSIPSSVRAMMSRATQPY